MKLFYRTEATSGKLFLISLLTHRAPSRPAGGRGNAFVFPIRQKNLWVSSGSGSLPSE
jgi:hypothetical protein